MSMNALFVMKSLHNYTEGGLIVHFLRPRAKKLSASDLQLKGHAPDRSGLGL